MPALRICSDCRCVPEPPPDDNPPGVVISTRWDEVHPADCPRVAFDRETQEQLDAQFAGFQRMRDRGAAEAHTAWVG